MSCSAQTQSWLLKASAWSLDNSLKLTGKQDNWERWQLKDVLWRAWVHLIYYVFRIGDGGLNWAWPVKSIRLSPKVSWLSCWWQFCCFPIFHPKWKWGIEFYLQNYWALNLLCCFACVSCQTALWNFTHWAKFISSMKASPATFQFTWSSLNTNIFELTFCLPCLFWRPKCNLFFFFLFFFPYDA